MKIALILAILCLLLTACRTNDGTLRREVVGTWTKDVPVNPSRVFWTDPVTFTYAFYPDGSYSETLGHRSKPVKFQGTWLVRGKQLVCEAVSARTLAASLFLLFNYLFCSETCADSLCMKSRTRM